MRAYALDTPCLFTEIPLTSRKQKPVAHIQACVFHGKSLARSSSFLTTSLIYGETNVGNILWDWAVLFVGVFGISMQKGKSLSKHLLFHGCDGGSDAGVAADGGKSTSYWMCIVYQAICINCITKELHGKCYRTYFEDEDVEGKKISQSYGVVKPGFQV